MTDADEPADPILERLAARSQRTEPASSAEPVFRLLASPYCRTILYAVLDREPPLDEVVAQVATWASDAGRVDTATAERHVALHVFHVCLPELVDVGLVRIDAEAGTLAVAPVPAAVRRLLHACRRYEQFDG